MKTDIKIISHRENKDQWGKQNIKMEILVILMEKIVLWEEIVENVINSLCDYMPVILMLKRLNILFQCYIFIAFLKTSLLEPTDMYLIFLISVSQNVNNSEFNICIHQAKC